MTTRTIVSTTRSKSALRRNAHKLGFPLQIVRNGVLAGLPCVVDERGGSYTYVGTWENIDAYLRVLNAMFSNQPPSLDEQFRALCDVERTLKHERGYFSEHFAP